MKTTLSYAALVLASSLSINASHAQTTEHPASEKAKQLAHEFLLIDTHIDVPYRINEHWENVAEATKDGDFDYPRAVEGGLNAPFMSIYIPASYEQSGGSIQLANQLIDSMEALVGRAPDKFAMAYSTDDIKQNKKKGLISLALGMENGTPIEGDLKNLQHFYDRGIRYITLAHSQSNHIADSSYDIRRQWHGLSPFGKELVKAMNKTGVMVDISHVSDEAFYQAVEISATPVIASHSSLRKYTPGFERNMSDDMLLALKKNGGVIQINFGSSFVAQQANRYGDMLEKRIEAVKKKYGEDSAETQRRIEELKANNPYPYATLEDVLDNIDHVVQLIGIDHVGVGSDFDGVGDSLPVGLKDVSDYPNLVQGLLDRGYSDADIKQILGGNLMRVWEANEAYAKTH
ncbi:peptidase M19 [Idiomarina tyrosinivorans]|uniref:Peptidase M19 n=1 Tax=Idiomarina tyrosinivorans TaxID=1445662 RepID=A0A432ZFY5_9GAMM|nr:dipeptidase [Idiomarina tyrosinivorans]RUO76887.1 peptidase M19 [Idiomarina tyrosinivorans]